MLITASGAGLTVVMAAMAVLWLIATIHHSLPAKAGLPPGRPVRSIRPGTGHGRLRTLTTRPWRNTRLGTLPVSVNTNRIAL